MKKKKKEEEKKEKVQAQKEKSQDGQPTFKKDEVNITET